jgi:hypothetical protein
MVMVAVVLRLLLVCGQVLQCQAACTLLPWVWLTSLDSQTHCAFCKKLKN